MMLNQAFLIINKMVPIITTQLMTVQSVAKKEPRYLWYIYRFTDNGAWFEIL